MKKRYGLITIILFENFLAMPIHITWQILSLLIKCLDNNMNYTKISISCDQSYPISLSKGTVMCK